MLSYFSPETAAICTISEVLWNPVVFKSKYIKELLSGDGFHGTMVISSKSAASSPMHILDFHVSPSKTDWEESFESISALSSKCLLFIDCWLCCKRFRFNLLANLTVCYVVKSPGERANFLLKTALVLYWRPLSWYSHLAVRILCVRVHWFSLNTSQTGPLKQYGEQYRTKVYHMARAWVCNLVLFYSYTTDHKTLCTLHGTRLCGHYLAPQKHQWIPFLVWLLSERLDLLKDVGSFPPDVSTFSNISHDMAGSIAFADPVLFLQHWCTRGKLPLNMAAAHILHCFPVRL